MKITVICKTTEWQVEQLKETAPKLGTDIDVRDISESGAVPENLGDVVLWRSSSLGSGIDRFNMMNKILKKHLLINRCLARLPRVAEKAFQPEYVQKKTKTIHCIPTFTFQSLREIETAIQEGILIYPFIQKPNKGSNGIGVKLIRKVDDLLQFAQDIEKQVYQNFIKNSGDYRVFILGGRALGVIKRTAQKGGFLNNISQGASADAITDPKIIAKLRRIGTTVASIFELALCGVDIIYDEKQDEYFFLEVNTVPQWRGFQEATGIDVASEIIQYCKRMVARGTIPTKDLVSEEYLAQIPFLGNKKFHFLSRLYLWSGNAFFKEKLDEMQEAYIGKTEDAHREKLKKIFTDKPEHGPRMVAKEARQAYFDTYPQLEPSFNLIFTNLFARRLYGIDLHVYIQELVSDEELLSLKRLLENDADAMRTLSTHAIQYLYILEEYLGTEASKVNPEKYLEIGMSYPDQSSELQIYFFTHCIIGASKFYTTNIEKNDLPIYIQMLKFIENIIKNNFESISLDNKFEFLVCAKICGYESTIEKDIFSEADRSLASDGNFLVDTHNTKASPNERNDFVGSEHRNVLYIMAQTPFRPLNRCT
ncbi:MAG: ATP-grasp domain-containing protein [Minisyncoccota bacterium]